MFVFPLRSFAPIFVKRLVWNRKHLGREINGSLCPLDFVDFLTPILRPSDRLVDLGCGQGNLLAALRARGWKGRYIGVDISERAIATAKQMQDADAEWCVSPIETFAARESNIVCFVESLYYARNVPELLRRWEHSANYIRICNSERHADVIAHLGGFHHAGLIWYS